MIEKTMIEKSVPLKELKDKNRISNRNLGLLLGVSSATVTRWLSGTFNISKDKQELINKLICSDNLTEELNEISKKESNQALSCKKNYLFNKKNITCEVEPFVVNAPSDQWEFYDNLIKLQLTGLDSDKYFKRLSFVRNVSGESSYLSKLAKSKPTSKQWNSNYGSHGWHRYVGRFPPHLVRSLVNFFNLQAGDVLLDPFCGSGTALVEGRLLGLSTIGIDVCPLSSLISRVKSKFPKSTSKLEQLVDDYDDFYSFKWSDFQNKKSTIFTHEDVINRAGNEIEPFVNYKKWFTPEALLGVSISLEYILSLSGIYRDIFAVGLSSSMRSIGNVDVDVVRAEYSRKPRENVDVKKLVLQKQTKFIKDIKAMLETHSCYIGNPSSISVINDSLLDANISESSVDAIITSPPYGVEVISYLRTHLLSYRVLKKILGLDPYTKHESIIGSEYLDSSKDSELWNASEHSGEFFKFFNSEIKDIQEKKIIHRKNMMMKFFFDMVEVAKKFKFCLKPNGSIAFVIGNKRVGDYLVPTHKIITEIFDSFDLKLEKTIKHKLKTNNSNSQVPWQDRIIDEEYILFFKKKI